MTTQIKGLVNAKQGLVDRRIFADPELYKMELEQIFGRCWLFIGHETMVPKPNDFAAAYMGEDPILLTRDGKGKLHAFLNMCRHRGNRICRADYGNAPSFMCTYHGWTFATDGKLVGVPGYKEAYFEELDRSQWGLVEARLDTYKELVFANWDNSAPSLIDYMGDVTFFLDLLLDRRSGGTEILPGVYRWAMDSNWKMGADNFGGDGYHVTITHGSMAMAGITRARSESLYAVNRYTVNPGNGHAVLGGYDGPPQPERIGNARSDIITDYLRENLPELRERLGEFRARSGGINVANMFPNFTWHPGPMVRAWQPRAPLKSEIWTYCIVDKKAPQEVKDEMRRKLCITFGPAGAMEADDMNNWSQCSKSGAYPAGMKVPMNLQLRLGQERKHEMLPGIIAPSPSEANQRAFYTRWQEVMEASSWSQIKVDPRTKSY